MPGMQLSSFKYIIPRFNIEIPNPVQVKSFHTQHPNFGCFATFSIYINEKVPSVKIPPLSLAL
jgi:hypothetical protein